MEQQSCRVPKTTDSQAFTDGRLRDFSELVHYDLAIYCRGETTRWGGDTVTPYEANRPVVIGGVAVCPGDYVFADASGAAVIPAEDVRAVLHRLTRRPRRTQNPSRRSGMKAQRDGCRSALPSA